MPQYPSIEKSTNPSDASFDVLKSLRDTQEKSQQAAISATLIAIRALTVILTYEMVHTTDYAKFQTRLSTYISLVKDSMDLWNTIHTNYSAYLPNHSSTPTLGQLAYCADVYEGSIEVIDDLVLITKFFTDVREYLKVDVKDLDPNINDGLKPFTELATSITTSILDSLNKKLDDFKVKFIKTREASLNFLEQSPSFRK